MSVVGDVGVLDPSKEPQPFSRGYRFRWIPTTSCTTPFKGATAFQPWILLCAGLWQCPFNGATAFQPWMAVQRRGRSYLQRSHGFSAMYRLQAGANGATAFQPWIRPGRCRWRRKQAPPFNGATAFQPWILREIRVTFTMSCRPRLRFQGPTFLSSYVCQCLSPNATMLTMKCARATPSMRVAPDLSHYERNQASLHTLPQSIQTTKVSLCLGFV